MKLLGKACMRYELNTFSFEPTTHCMFVNIRKIRTTVKKTRTTRNTEKEKYYVRAKTIGNKPTTKYVKRDLK